MQLKHPRCPLIVSIELPSLIEVIGPAQWDENVLGIYWTLVMGSAASEKHEKEERSEAHKVQDVVVVWSVGDVVIVWLVVGWSGGRCFFSVFFPCAKESSISDTSRCSRPKLCSGECDHSQFADEEGNQDLQSQDEAWEQARWHIKTSQGTQRSQASRQQLGWHDLVYPWPGAWWRQFERSLPPPSSTGVRAKRGLCELHLCKARERTSHRRPTGLRSHQAFSISWSYHLFSNSNPTQDIGFTNLQTAQLKHKDSKEKRPISVELYLYTHTDIEPIKWGR